MRAPVQLKAGRDKPVRQGHPWVFSGAIEQLPPASVANSSIVAVMSHEGEFLAQGYLNRKSQIQVRLLSWNEAEVIDRPFWRQRLQQAIQRREPLRATTNALRLVNAESDGLPGLTVDQFDRWLVMQVSTLGIERHKRFLAEQLLELTGCEGVLERSDLAVRQLEGLEPAQGVLIGTVPDHPITITEQGHRFIVHLADGQKTGYYTDQRTNRQRVAAYAHGATVLNGYSYSGSFAAYLLAAGAERVVNVDSSREALALAAENMALNGYSAQVEQLQADLPKLLRQWLEAAEPPRFDLIILDPPKFASHKGQLDRALRGYKEINRLALQLLNPGGYLATFSCSGLVSLDLFQKVIFGASVDAGRPAQILEWLHQASDHPVALTFPEGEYLKGLLLRVG